MWSRPLIASLARLGTALLAVAIVWTSTQAQKAQPDDTSPARLVARVREAEAMLKQAARPDASNEERHRAIVAAAERLEALGSEPDAAAPRVKSPLDPDMRADLRRRAAQLRTASSANAVSRDDMAALVTLVEQARAQLEKAVGLRLDFQGNYSQSTPKEPAYGGHASAMGPAPVGPAEPALASPVTFEERERLPTRTYCGGPTKDHILESGGNGVALFDYDGDGLLDIYLVTAAELTPARVRVPHRNALYRNLGNWKFEDVSARAGVDAAAWGNGVCVGDVDNDGRLDIYVTNWGPNFLFHNRGDGTFEEIAAKAGVAAGGWSTGCTFFDADGDGDLDLYVARYVETTWDEVVNARRTLVWRDGPHIMVGPAGLPGESDLFFENLGNGHFAEATAAHGFRDDAGAYGFGVVSTDYDDDGLVDLFVANDSNPNFLYHNLGQGKFENVGLTAGVAINEEGRAQAGMGVDAGDYDGDGRMDLVLTTFAHDRKTIYRNVNGHRFEDASAPAGLAVSTFQRMGWGVAFFDADLDGRPDLFFSNGHIFSDIDSFPALGESYRQKNQLLLNVGGRFRDVSDTAGAGLQIARVGRGLAVGDLDNDGDLDVVISNMDDAPTLLENRQRTGHHWIAFKVESPTGNRFAIGAKVTIDAGGRKQFREIRSGGSYLSQNDLRTYFGLGDYSGTVAVDVRMPGGHHQDWTGLAPDRLHTLTLSSGTFR